MTTAASTPASSSPTAPPCAFPPRGCEPEYADHVRADRERLAALCEELRTLSADEDPKLAALVEVLETSPADKVAVFATYAATVSYLDEHLPGRVGAASASPSWAARPPPTSAPRCWGALRPTPWCAPATSPPQGQVDLVISTDALRCTTRWGFHGMS